ncbi:MAG: sporulation transcriptional regulator SpoIIID [Clostridia bacterium]
MLSYEIEDRVQQLARYIVDTKSTVRKAAKEFGISKSTVHVDVTKRLEKINPILAEETKKILKENKLERHIRGGLATRRKYQAQNICKV